MINTAASGNKNAEMIRVLIPVIIVLILIFFGKKLLDGITNAIGRPFELLDIKDTAEEKEKIKQAEKAIDKINSSAESNPFNPNYFKLKEKQHKNVLLLTVAAATKLADQIKGGIGAFYDEPEKIVAAFYNCKSKTQVSFLAKIFNDKYGVDLLSFLEDKLDTTAQKIALGKIINYVNGLNVGKL